MQNLIKLVEKINLDWSKLGYVEMYVWNVRLSCRSASLPAYLGRGIWPGTGIPESQLGKEESSVVGC